MHFNLGNIVMGLIALVLGVDKLLQNFSYELIPLTIPNIVYYIILALAGLLLLIKGLGLGKHHYYN